MRSLPKREGARIDKLVAHYVANQHLFETLLKQLHLHFESDRRLMQHVHSMRWRVKNPDHLKDKLRRKWVEAAEEGTSFNITPENLFEKINDLAGFRIIHLYTRQFEAINRALTQTFKEQRYGLLEGPEARTWDNESKSYFESIGVATKDSNYYTSVHYVLEANSRSKLTCELQVRTLAEEIWGEVDHTINYPHPTAFVPCREQLRVLARVTSGCTRLVDAIFTSHDSAPPRLRARRTRSRA